jgi:hypothetical protein
MQGYVLFLEIVGGKLNCQNHKRFSCINSSECIFPSQFLLSLIFPINTIYTLCYLQSVQFPKIYFYTGAAEFHIYSNNALFYTIAC